MITLFIIAITLIVLFWVTSKLRQKWHLEDAFATQINFMRLYMRDDTDKLFYNKTLEESEALGQDLIYTSARNFRAIMHDNQINETPLERNDLRLLKVSIAIIKAAEAMVYITDNGPIMKD